MFSTKLYEENKLSVNLIQFISIPEKGITEMTSFLELDTISTLIIIMEKVV